MLHRPNPILMQTLLILGVATGGAEAQTSGIARVFEEVSERDVRLDDEQRRLLDGYRSRPTTGDSRIVRVDFDLLASEPSVDLGVFGESILVDRDRIETRAEDDMSWFGRERFERNRAVLVSKGGRLTGSFYDGSPSSRTSTRDGYAVRFIGGDLHVVLKIDPTVPIPPEAEPTIVGPGDTGGGGSMPCHTFTLMVVFTPAAAAKEGDIFGVAQDLVDDFNVIFDDSDVGLKAFLNYVYVTDYDEYEKIGNGKHAQDQDIYILEDRFQGKNDGYMDEVHNFRNLVGADIAVLIGDGESPAFNRAGRASAIAAEEDSAFAVVADWYAGGPYHYTFHHEVGHLLGARHDVDTDGSLEPFAYGHGYIHVSGNDKWRTIMAYNHEGLCGPFPGCERIPHFSNPDVDYDNAPTGDGTTADNARVFDERACVVAGFRKGVWK